MKDFINTFLIKKYFEWPSRWPGGNVDVAWNIEKTRQEVAEIKGKIDQTTAKKEAYQNKEQELGQKSQELSQTIANSEKKIADHSEKIADFGAQIEEKNAQISALENTISSIEWSRAQTVNAVDSMQKNIASILASVRAMEWQEWKEGEVARFRGMAANFQRQVAHFSQEIAKMTATIEVHKVELEARKNEKSQLEDQKKNEEGQKSAEIARKNDLIEQRTMTEFQKNLQHKNVVMSEDYIRDLMAKQKAAVARQVAETKKKVEENVEKQEKIQEEVKKEEKLDFDAIEQHANSIVDELRKNPEGESARDIAKRVYEYEQAWRSFEEAAELAILDKARESSWSERSAKKIEDLKVVQAEIVDENKNISNETQSLVNASQGIRTENLQVVENETKKTGQSVDAKSSDGGTDILSKKQDDEQWGEWDLSGDQSRSENNSQESFGKMEVNWSASGVVDVTLGTENSVNLPSEDKNSDENVAKNWEDTSISSGENKWEDATSMVNMGEKWENNQSNWSEVSAWEKPVELSSSEIIPTTPVSGVVDVGAKPVHSVKIDSRTAASIRAGVNTKPQSRSVQSPERVASRPVSQHENLKKMNNARQQLADILRKADISLNSLRAVLSQDALSAFESFQTKPSPETFRRFETEIVKQVLLGNFESISADKNSPEWQEFKSLYLVNPNNEEKGNNDFTIKDLELSLSQKDYLSFSELHENFGKGKKDILGTFLYESKAIELLQILSKNVNEIHRQDLVDKENWVFDENRYENGTRVEESKTQEGNLTTHITRTTRTAEESNNIQQVKNSYASDEVFQARFKEYSPKIADIANKINERGGFKKSEFQDAYRAHFLNIQSWLQQASASSNEVSVNFSRTNVFTGRIATAEQARTILSDGGSIPLRKPDNTENSVEVLIFYKDPRVEKLSMSINGNEINPPENLEAMDRFRYMKFLSDNADHPLLGRILKSPYWEWLKYFEEKFASKYPNEKLGQHPHHFFEVVANEIAEKAWISDLKVEWEEWVKGLIKRFEDTNFVREIDKKMNEAKVVDLSGKIDRRSIFLANEQNKRLEHIKEAEQQLESDWPNM